MLPPEFADLEPFAETWCLATEPERWERRLATSLEDMLVDLDGSAVVVKSAAAKAATMQRLGGETEARRRSLNFDWQKKTKRTEDPDFLCLRGSR